MTGAAERGFAFVFAFRVAACGLALGVVAACSRAPCMKLHNHPFSYPAASPDDLARFGTESKPRCEATDPTCGPEAYHSDRACYDPSAPRKLIEEPSDEPGIVDRRHARRSGSERCAHDGECVLISSCHTCAHYSKAAWVMCAKKWVPYDEEALCGCVDGGCWFFRN